MKCQTIQSKINSPMKKLASFINKYIAEDSMQFTPEELPFALLCTVIIIAILFCAMKLATL